MALIALPERPILQHAATEDFDWTPAHQSARYEDLSEMLLSLGQNAALGTAWSNSMSGVNYEIIPNRLSFALHTSEVETMAMIKKHKRLFYFSSWMQESYQPFNSDFGPVNLSATVRFCDFVQEKMTDERLHGRHLVYYSDAATTHASNTAFLLGAYLVLVHKWTPEEAANPFMAINPSPFKPFRDATNVPSTFDLNLIDCLRGLQRAVESGFFCYKGFDIEAYDQLDDADMADMHIICPKLLAFRGPSEDASMAKVCKAPADYVALFSYLKVTAVVRLNEPQYDKEAFSAHGIKVLDLYYDDCTAPPEHVVQDFLAACEVEEGMVAVHCMAGLGRTGTLIAAWIMSKHGWSAREAIAWVRIVRPGSVIGPQQHWLELFEQRLRGHNPDVTDLTLANMTDNAHVAAAQVKQASQRKALEAHEGRVRCW